MVEDSGLKLGEINEIILVGGQTRMPAMQKAVKDLFGKEPNKSVNPDEVVAVGAAVQGGIMKGEVKMFIAGCHPVVAGHRNYGRRLH